MCSHISKNNEAPQKDWWSLTFYHSLTLKTSTKQKTNPDLKTDFFQDDYCNTAFSAPTSGSESVLKLSRKRLFFYRESWVGLARMLWKAAICGDRQTAWLWWFKRKCSSLWWADSQNELLREWKDGKLYSVPYWLLNLGGEPQFRCLWGGEKPD